MTGSEAISGTTFSIAVTDGKVRVEASLDRYQDQDETCKQLFCYAMDLARAVAEVASISCGVAYVPVFEHVIFPDGRKCDQVLADRRLAKLMTIFPDYSFEQVLGLVISDVALMRVLSDVVVILTWQHYCPIAAGRVVDSILRMLTGGQSRSSDWQKMRETLRVDEAYLRLLTDRSKGLRHGDREYVDSQTNRQLAERAWTLMNRYLAYRLGGNQPLDHEKFPLMQGEKVGNAG